MDNMMMQNASPQQQQQPQAPPQPQAPGADEVAGGHKALEAVIEGLIKLVSLPKGELSRKDVFDETSSMIANGAFPTKEARQQLIAELANLPQTEEGIREVLGQHLLTAAEFSGHYHNAFGPPQQAEGLA